LIERELIAMNVNVLRFLRQITLVAAITFSILDYINYGVAGIILYLAIIEIEEL